MRTVLFVEQYDERDLFIVGFRLSRTSVRYSPPGIIRIARIETSFNIINNMGYYGDIYMKRFVKKIRSYIRKKNIINCRTILKNSLNDDIINIIIQFI
jgi:hypothetical protein